MKRKIKKQDIQNLASGIIAALGLASYIFITVLILNKLIAPGWFLIWLGVTTLVLQLDSLYIERHFVNGEWV